MQVFLCFLLSPLPSFFLLLFLNKFSILYLRIIETHPRRREKQLNNRDNHVPDRIECRLSAASKEYRKLQS